MAKQPSPLTEDRRSAIRAADHQEWLRNREHISGTQTHPAQRAATIPDRRKTASAQACRNRRHW